MSILCMQQCVIIASHVNIMRNFNLMRHIPKTSLIVSHKIPSTLCLIPKAVGSVDAQDRLLSGKFVILILETRVVTCGTRKHNHAFAREHTCVLFKL